jgi:uncharacterized repeat protein (TIGR04138 family)
MPDSEAIARLHELLRQDKRYRPQAYQFVLESLQYAQERLRLGTERESEPGPPRPAAESGEAQRPERHLTGQELCEAARKHALEQFGYMAQLVLATWGVRCTSDFGEIVYNMIGVGLMKKTKDDRREDFDDVFDFDEGLQRSFRISMPS